MAAGLPEFIPADVRARLRDLHLLARRPSGSPGFGAHPSRSRGAGLEFAQYRAYQQGDDPRHGDNDPEEEDEEEDGYREKEPRSTRGSGSKSHSGAAVLPTRRPP